MSVQQQIDRISTEVSAQTTLLDQALAAIANKAAGGGGSGGNVDVCNVALMHRSMLMGFNLYSATCYEDGAFAWKSEANLDDVHIVNIANVVIGSVVTVDAYSYTSVTCTDAEEIAASANSTTCSFRITAAPGDVAFIEFVDD